MTDPTASREEMGFQLLSALIDANEEAKKSGPFRDSVFEILDPIEKAAFTIIDDLLGLPGSGITYYFFFEGRDETHPGHWGCVADGGWTGWNLSNLDEFRAFVEHNKTCPEKCAMGDKEGFVPTQRMKDEHRAFIAECNAKHGADKYVIVDRSA